MSGTTSGRPSGITSRVTDLVAVLAMVTVTALVVGLGAPRVLRVPAALVSVLVLPGYACSVALFPAGDRAGSTGRYPTHGGITLLERGVLTVGLSLALVALSGLLLDALVGRLTTTTLLVTVAVVTVGLVAAAALRRRRVPAPVRYEPTLASVGERDGAVLGGLDPLTVALLLSVLFAGGAIAAPVSVGDTTDGVTELYLLAEGEDGTLQRSAYPTELPAGRSQPISVAVGHGGGDPATYTVVGQLQRAERGANGTVIRDRDRIATWRVRVDPGRTRVRNETVTVAEPGTYRLAYLLYRGEPPANPRTDDAYREVHLWITVTEVSG